MGFIYMYMYKGFGEVEGQDKNSALWQSFYNNLWTVSNNVLVFCIWLEVICSWTLKKGDVTEN